MGSTCGAGWCLNHQPASQVENLPPLADGSDAILQVGLGFPRSLRLAGPKFGRFFARLGPHFGRENGVAGEIERDGFASRWSHFLRTVARHLH